MCQGGSQKIKGTNRKKRKILNKLSKLENESEIKVNKFSTKQFFEAYHML